MRVSHIARQASRQSASSFVRIASGTTSGDGGVLSILGVLKRHRPDPFLLSHGLDGWSLALDFRVTRDRRERLWELGRAITGLVLAGLKRTIAANAALVTMSVAAIAAFGLAGVVDPAVTVPIDTGPALDAAGFQTNCCPWGKGAGGLAPATAGSSSPAPGRLTGSWCPPAMITVPPSDSIPNRSLANASGCWTQPWLSG